MEPVKQALPIAEYKKQIGELNATISMQKATLQAFNVGLFPGADAEAIYRLKGYHSEALKLSEQKSEALQKEFNQIIEATEVANGG